MRVPPHAVLSFVVAALVLSATTAAALGASSATAPRDTLFKRGYNKCKLASLAAVNKTSGKKFAEAKFDGKTCTWSSSDGAYVILVDTNTATTRAVMDRTS